MPYTPDMIDAERERRASLSLAQYGLDGAQDAARQGKPVSEASIRAILRRLMVGSHSRRVDVPR